MKKGWWWVLIIILGIILILCLLFVKFIPVNDPGGLNNFDPISMGELRDLKFNFFTEQETLTGVFLPDYTAKKQFHFLT